MKDTLQIDGGPYQYYIRWFLAEEGDLGGYLGQSKTDGKGEAPRRRGNVEHWVASKAVRETQPKRDSTGFFWVTLRDAEDARRLCRAALRAHAGAAFTPDTPAAKKARALPAWAIKAKAEGWKAPNGWKA